MQNHVHTDAVQLVITALAVAVIFHLARAGAGLMVDSDNRLVSTLGKGIGGVFTFGSSS